MTWTDSARGPGLVYARKCVTKRGLPVELMANARGYIRLWIDVHRNGIHEALFSLDSQEALDLATELLQAVEAVRAREAA